MILYINCNQGPNYVDLQKAIKQLFTNDFSVDKPVDNVNNFFACGEISAAHMAEFREKAGIDGVFAHPKVLNSPVGEFVHSLGAEFCEQPAMDVKKCGCSGSVQVFLGEFCQPQTLCLLSCNLDDMTGEAIGFALEELLRMGALDVWTEAIGMKKSRPGIKLCVLCKPEQQGTFLTAILRHTTTLGVRCQEVRRYARSRHLRELSTPFGTVRVKVTNGTRKPEYEDVAKIARGQAMTYQEVLDQIEF